MKKFLTTFILIASLTILSSCTLFSNGPATTKEEKGRAKIENVDNQLSANIANKLNVIGELAYGTDYALGKMTNPPIEVSVARDMNQRVESIAGSPSVENMKEMQRTIDKLTSALEMEQKEGKILLDIEDKKLTALQNETTELISKKEAEVQNYMTVAQLAASKSDVLKVELNKMDAWGGFGAIWYGVKSLIVKSMWAIGISGVLFIVLRIFAASNPIAGAIFSIFNVVGGYVIKAIGAVVPKAIEFSGHIATSAYTDMKGILTKIVDNVQSLKDMQTKLGHDITLKEVFGELDKSMDTVEKDVIDKIKKDLGY